MTKNVNNLNWRSTGKDGTKWVGLVTADSVVDNNWEISITGNIQNSDYNISPRFLTIDNLANNGTVTIDFGSYQFSVPPFQREPFDIPDGLRRVKVTVTVGAVNCWFSEEKIAQDQSNNLLVQQTAALTLIYTFVGYNANQSQLVSDLNKSILFAPTAANMTYALLPITTPVSNGWLEFIDNFGTKTITLAPNGIDTITYNGIVYTAGSPLVLAPGASGYLRSDGTKWYFAGTAGKSLLLKTVAATTSQGAQDDGVKIIFNSAAAINWSLLGIVASTGPYWSQYVQNIGAGAVSILANGADTINGVFTSAIPLILNKGDSGLLSTDGTSWYFQGSTHFESAQIALAPSFNTTQNHLLGKKPDLISVVLQCTTANLGYAIGDEVEPPYYDQGTIGNGTAYWKSATQFGCVITGGGPIMAIPNKGTGTVANITNTSWRVILRAFTNW